MSDDFLVCPECGALVYKGKDACDKCGFPTKYMGEHYSSYCFDRYREWSDEFDKETEQLPEIQRYNEMKNNVVNYTSEELLEAEKKAEEVREERSLIEFDKGDELWTDPIDKYEELWEKVTGEKMPKKPRRPIDEAFKDLEDSMKKLAENTHRENMERKLNDALDMWRMQQDPIYSTPWGWLKKL